jgi:diacylglycerol kinase family enzyme
VFPSTRYADLLRYGWGILRAAHHRLADVQYLQTSGFTCQAPAGQDAAFELDGEDAGDSPVRFGLVRGGLRLVAATGERRC